MEVFVEGTISSGKSTLLENMKALLSPIGCEILPEPVHDWASTLVKFYENPPRHAFHLQMRVLHSFVDRRPEDPENIVLYERSPVACKHVFGHMLEASGTLSREEANLFRRYYDTLFGSRKFGNCIFVYVDVDTAIERKKLRSRTDDALVDPGYMQGLHKRYLEVVRPLYLDALKRTGICWGLSPYFSKVAFIDGSRNPEDVARLAIKALNMLSDKTIVDTHRALI